MRPSRIFGVDCLTIISELSEVLCYVRHTNRMLFDIINPESFLSNFRGSIQVFALRPKSNERTKVGFIQVCL